jgi:flagellar hook-basal body complex protein FliE
MSIRIEPQGPELQIRPAETAVVGESEIGSPNGTLGSPDFAQILMNQVADANKLGKLADQKAEALAKGASDDLHGTMISLKEADISMKLVGSVRNRLLDAFHELWRINL